MNRQPGAVLLVIGMIVIAGCSPAAQPTPTTAPTDEPTPTPTVTLSPTPSRTLFPSETPVEAEAQAAATATEAPPNTPPPTAEGCSPRADWTFEYRVQRGEFLSSIAARAGVSLDEMAEANCIENPSVIQVGQVLRVPRIVPTPTPTDTPTSVPTATPTDTPTGIPAATATATDTPTGIPGTPVAPSNLNDDDLSPTPTGIRD